MEFGWTMLKDAQESLAILLRSANLIYNQNLMNMYHYN